MHVEWSIVILASICVAAGLVGNVVSRPRSLPSLLIFGAVFIIPVQLMLNRVRVLQIIREITVGRRGDDENLWMMYSPNNGMSSQRDRQNVSPSQNAELLMNSTNLGIKSAELSKEGETKASGGTEKKYSKTSRRESKDSNIATEERSRSKSLLKAALNDQTKLDRLFLDAVKNVRALLDSDRATLWLIDAHNKVLWSKVAEGVPHIRVPMDKGIVGWTCMNNKTVNIPDAYKDDRFNPGVDKKTGYKTSTILCAPINVQVADDGHSNSENTKMVGIIQVINKNGPDGAHFTTHDERTLENFCSRIGPAVHRCQTKELTGVELRRTLRDIRKEMSIMR